ILFPSSERLISNR
nr:Chain C, PEPTIDE MTF-E (13N3E) [synthetic construct]1ED3_F Chain F, PEPTIDE MTF-E (13N3E) [synthetic construct]